MSERITTTAQGRLSGFDKRKDAAARKRYVDEVLGDAGVTDFSLEARRKLEDQTEFDQYMQRFSRDTRDAFDATLDAAESGKLESRGDKAAKDDPRLRRIAKLALSIEQMAADGSGQRIANAKTGKTVLDYRMEKLRELQDEYARSTPSERPAATKKSEKTVEPDTTPETESTNNSGESEKTNEEPSVVSPEENDVDGNKSDSEATDNEGSTPQPEKKDDNDTYEVGTKVVLKILAFKDGQIDPSVKPLVYPTHIAKVSDNGELFALGRNGDLVPVERKTLDAWQEEYKPELENWRNTVMLKEYARKDDGSLDRSNPTGWREWTITDGPDRNGWVRLQNGDEKIVRHESSLALWSRIYTEERAEGKNPQPAPSVAAKPESEVKPDDAEKQAEDFIAGIPGRAKAPEAEAKPVRDRNFENVPAGHPFKSERAAKIANSIENLAGVRRGSIEKSTAAVRRAFALETKSSREAAKRLILERLGGQKAADRYADSAFGTLDRTAISFIGRALRLNKTPKQRNDKAVKQLGKNNRRNRK